MLSVIQRSPVKGTCLALALTAALAGCGKNPEELVASGRSYLDKGDPKTASLELRNALQKDPDLAEAR
jgi:Tfp pilus assembly protein PilF